MAPTLLPTRIALFGGSFDPPHFGHLAIARAAADTFRLDQVLFAPVARQPLKPAGAAAPFADRLAMTTLACAADPRFIPSTLDAPRPGGVPNFTTETLLRLHQEHPQATLFLILGIDSFQTLAAWHDPQSLLALAECIVVSRPGYPLHQPLPDPPGLSLTPGQRARIHPLPGVLEDISATTLRQRLQADDPCAALLPPGVASYIRQHRLYLPPTDNRHLTTEN